MTFGGGLNEGQADAARTKSQQALCIHLESIADWMLSEKWVSQRKQ